MFGISPIQMLIVLVIVLLLFGHRLPSVMRSLGRGMVEFKRGTQEGTEDENFESSNKTPQGQA